MERIALIDLGTNTFHLLITEIRDRDQLVEFGKYKAPVKLGEKGMPGGKITDAAYKRGITTLRDFKQVIDAAGVTTVLAFATSAIRSASNGKAFVDEVYQRTGIRIRVINGNEEASLIHEGVKNGVSLPKDEPVLIVDIGGGSVEFYCLAKW
jgi:exopolyphosphatase/guanosine-5'-triphosphate,3'-diphosphate pyrophosphatase